MSSKRPREKDEKSRFWDSARNRVRHFYDVLDQETFTIEDMQADEHNAQSALLTLEHAGFIKSVGRTKPETDDDTKRNPVTVWKWVNCREELKEYHETRDEMPCGCKPHIPPHTDDDGLYICKYCESKHPRDVIKDVL